MAVTIDTSRVSSLIAAATSEFAALVDSPAVDLTLTAIEGGVLAQLISRDSRGETHLTASARMNYDCEWIFCEVANHTTREVFSSSPAAVVAAVNAWAGCPVNGVAA